MPGGKVVHVSDEVHARVRAHCDARRIPMRPWVEEVLTHALDDQPPAVLDVPEDVLEDVLTHMDDQPPEAAPAVARPPAVVSKKPLPELVSDTGDEPWARPPFWKRCRSA